MKIPEYVENIMEKLEGSGYEAYLVGGCVRDLLMDRKPYDWDITTNAKPEEIQKIFSRRSQSEIGTPTESVGADYDTFYENDFGTVGIKVQKSKIPPSPILRQWLRNGKARLRRAGKNQNDGSKLKNDSDDNAEMEIVEVTPYRKETTYSDKRHPDRVEFTSNVEDDLARRDFTMNAIALKIPNDKSQIPNKSQILNSKFQTKNSNYHIIDPFDGQKDINAKIIRAVGNPEDRFSEDALRLMRAVRFSAQLNFNIDPLTESAIKSKAGLLKMISRERVRDELIKLIGSDNPEKGIVLTRELGLLKIILPELEECVGVTQNKHHKYNVFDHLVKTLGFAAEYDYNIFVRFASLLHDVGKPRSKVGEGPDSTFHGHEYISAKMTARILERLKFPKDFAEKVYTLVRYHMFYYNVGEVTDKSVRRLVRKVGPENIGELLEVRQAERKGSGVPKAEPYKLRHLKYMIEKVSMDPLTVGMLKTDGNEVMKTLGIEPGPRVGYILNALLEEVIDNPELNTREYLIKRMEELNQLGEKDLIELAQAGKDKLEEEVEKEDESIKERYYVK